MGLLRDGDSRLSWNKVVVRGVHRAPVVKGDFRLQPTTMDIGYHILDLNARDGTPLLSHLPHTLHHFNFNGSMVALRSQLYLFGKNIYLPHDHHGYEPPNTTYSLDLTPHHERQWKRLADPLTINQFHLDCVVFREKIYVFRDSEYSCICQVFDPKLNTWSPIKSPPVGGVGVDEDIELGSPVMVDSKNKRIIVYFRNISTLYAYYPIDDRWECVVEGFGGWRRGETLITIAQGIIYLFYPSASKGMFTAYDLDTKQWLQVSPAPGFRDYFDNQHLNREYYDALFHRGDGFLALFSWTHNNCESLETRISLVNVLQFKVKVVKKNDTKEVLVSPLSSKSFPLDSGPRIFDFHPLPLIVTT